MFLFEGGSLGLFLGFSILGFAGDLWNKFGPKKKKDKLDKPAKSEDNTSSKGAVSYSF